MISGNITVARLLDEHPELVDVLASYHPHFKQLRNKLLRRVMAPRVTLAQAARIAGVSPDELVSTLRRAVGEADTTPHPALSPKASETLLAPSPSLGEGRGEGGIDQAPKPETLARVPESRQVHVDVRDDIRRGQEPFTKVMAAVKALGLDQVLVLRTPFEPIPLYDVLGKRGFAHWTDYHRPEDWSVWFYRDAAAADAAPTSTPAVTIAGGESGRVVIDVRGLEPPQPLVRVLEALERLGPGERLEVLHERRPMFLYPQLDERGFIHDTDEPEPGLVRILIRRGEAA